MGVRIRGRKIQVTQNCTAMTSVTNNKSVGRIIATVASEVLFDSQEEYPDDENDVGEEDNDLPDRVLEVEVVADAGGVICVVSQAGRILWKDPYWETSDTNSLAKDGAETKDETEAWAEEGSETETETE